MAHCLFLVPLCVCAFFCAFAVFSIPSYYLILRGNSHVPVPLQLSFIRPSVGLYCHFM